MRLTLTFVNAPSLDSAPEYEFYKTTFELPETAIDLTDIDSRIESLVTHLGALTAVSLYVTCQALGWREREIKTISAPERVRAVWNAAVFGFDQTNPESPERGRYLKVPFAVVPPFELFMFRGTRKRGSIRRAVRQPLTAVNEDQEIYLERVEQIAETCLSLLETHPDQTWAYIGFHPDRFDISLYRQYIRKDALRILNDPTEEETTIGEQVYFIQQGDNGPIKIGYSADPHKRLQSLSTASPYPLRLLKVIDGGWMLEQTLHRRFAEHQLEGEWFAPAPELLAFIAGDAVH